MQVRYQTAPRSDYRLFLGRLSASGDFSRERSFYPDSTRVREGPRRCASALLQRFRIFSSYSSSMRICLAICWLWNTSVRASSPVK